MLKKYKNIISVIVALAIIYPFQKSDNWYLINPVMEVKNTSQIICIFALSFIIYMALIEFISNLIDKIYE